MEVKRGLEVFSERLVARDELGRVGGRRPFHDLSAGDTAAPDLSGECGAPPNSGGTQISRRKDPAYGRRESLGLRPVGPTPRREPKKRLQGRVIYILTRPGSSADS